MFEHLSRPKTIAETGLSLNFLIGLSSKFFHERGMMTPEQLASVLKLPKLVCRQIIEEMNSISMLESQGLESSDIRSDIRYALTDAGRKLALESMQVSQYLGPAPVSLEAFSDQVRRQSIAHEEVHHNDLTKALNHLVLPKGMMAQLGPAANSGRSVLLYGEAGNGKTSIAEALGNSFHQTIAMPYAVAVGSQVIRFYDETLHEVSELEEGAALIDSRWVPCKRPVVIAGGELSLSMLDLQFEPTSRFYEAPIHLKAIGGVFVLDDFGRQTSTPQEFLNRWIVPLEKGFDIMSLHTGQKFTLPFDQLVVFSSNMWPEELGDDAALRRIYFKIFVPSPTDEDYLQIFEDACDDFPISWNRSVVANFFEREYRRAGIVTSGAHPRFLLGHIVSICRYLQQPAQLSDELLTIAWKNVAKSRKRVGG